MPQEQRKPSESGPSPLLDVAQALRDVAGSLEAESDVQHGLAAIVASVTDTVSGAEQAGVSLREGKRLQTVASTSDLTKQINAIEHKLYEGPRRQALLDHRSYRIDDTSTDARWPRFAAAADARGVSVDARIRALRQRPHPGDARSVLLETERVRRQLRGHRGIVRRARRYRAELLRSAGRIPQSALAPRHHRDSQRNFDAPRRHHRGPSLQSAGLRVAKFQLETSRSRRPVSGKRHAPRRIGVLTNSAQLVNSRFVVRSRRGP